MAGPRRALRRLQKKNTESRWLTFSAVPSTADVTHDVSLSLCLGRIPDLLEKYTFFKDISCFCKFKPSVLWSVATNTMLSIPLCHFI